MIDDKIFSRCFFFNEKDVISFILLIQKFSLLKTILMNIFHKICCCTLHKLIMSSFSRQHRLCSFLCLNWTLLNLPCYLVPCQKHSKMVPPNSCITISRIPVTPVWWVLWSQLVPLYWSRPLCALPRTCSNRIARRMTTDCMKLNGFPRNRHIAPGRMPRFLLKCHLLDWECRAVFEGKNPLPSQVTSDLTINACFVTLSPSKNRIARFLVLF